MSNKRRIVFATLTIVWCYIIYSFSGATGEESQGTSMGIVKVFVDSFFPFVEDEQTVNFLNFIIRKAAHMTEYAVLFLFGYSFTKTFNISKLKIYTNDTDNNMTIPFFNNIGNFYKIPYNIKNAPLRM